MTDNTQSDPTTETKRLMDFLANLSAEWETAFTFKNDKDGERIPSVTVSQDFERTVTVTIVPTFTNGRHTGYRVTRSVDDDQTIVQETKLTFTEALHEAEKAVTSTDMLATSDAFASA